MRPKTLKRWISLAIVVWVGLVSLGMFLVNDFSNVAGRPAAAPQHWPEDASIDRSSEGYTLLMMVHPRCPCSRASLWELQGIMKKVHEKVDAHVFFYHPDDAATDWSKTHLWDIASTIAATQVVQDIDGLETKKFGAFTSGQVLLYDESGDLRFAGGINPYRGHMGDSAGKTAIMNILEKEPESSVVQASQSLVFGCPIRGYTDDCTDGYCLQD